MENTQNKGYFNSNSYNDHLLNILDKNYYIELGDISINVLEELLSRKYVNISKIYDSDIALNGVGKITEDSENDATIQVSFLKELKDKSSTTSFIITCGTLLYLDEEGNEKYAPIVLIPVTIKYVDNTVYMSEKPRVNEKLISFLIHRDIEESVEKILRSVHDKQLRSVYEIDDACKQIADAVKLPISTSNYLTYYENEYAEFNHEPDFFNRQHSIYEMKNIDLLNEFFENIKSITPTNNDQKYVLLKAHNGESFVVDGKFGTGKSSTILNIISDKISDGKKVLYINQDVDNLNEMRNLIIDNELLKFEVDLSNSIYNYKEIQSKSIKAAPSFDMSLIQKLSAMGNIYSYKYHGYKYQDIIETLTYYNMIGVNEVLDIEVGVDRNEVEHIYQSFKRIEEELKMIDPFPNNVWVYLLTSKTAPTVEEMKARTIDYKNINEEFVNQIFAFCKKYGYKKVESYNEINHLAQEILNFEEVKPLACWFDDDFTELSQVALREIQEAKDVNYECLNHYQKKCTPDYKAGSVEKYFKEITLDRYVIEGLDSPDAKYVDLILSKNEKLDSLLAASKKFVEKSFNDFNISKAAFNFKEESKDEFNLFNKIYDIYTNVDIEDKWIEEYLENKKEYLNKINTLEDYYNEFLKTENKIIPFIDLDKYSYAEIERSVNNKHKIRAINHLIDKKALRKSKKNFKEFVNDLEQYCHQSSLIIDLIPTTTKKSRFIKSTWLAYLNYGLFIKDLSTFENENYTYFLKNNKKDKSFDIKNYLNNLNELRNDEKELEILKENLSLYNINIEGKHFIDSVRMIEGNISYIEKAIAARNNIINCFLTYGEVTTTDVSVLIEVDNYYLETLKKLDDNSARYIALFGSKYDGLNTQLQDIIKAISSFKSNIGRLLKPDSFLKYLKQSGKIDNGKIKLPELIDDAKALININEDWRKKLRDFSGCFYYGKNSIENDTIEEVTNLLNLCYNKLDQIEHVSIIEHELGDTAELGLKKLPVLVREGKLGKGAADIFLNSVMHKYDKELADSEFVAFDKVNFVETSKAFYQSEINYCINNLYNIINKKYKNSKNKKIKTKEYINPINELIINSDNSSFIYLADLGNISEIDNLDYFDTIIVDDAHLANACCYDELFKKIKQNQVLVFGDNTFNNNNASLLSKLDEHVSIDLKRRYLEMSSEFNNHWNDDNKYIYSLESTVVKEKYSSINKMIEAVVRTFESSNKTITVLVDNDDLKRDIFKEIVCLLKSDAYNTFETIKYLKTKFHIINIYKESNYKSDECYVWYSLLKELDYDDKLKIASKYFTSSIIHLCIQSNIRDDDNINKFCGKITPRNIYVPDGVVKLFYERLDKAGLHPEHGPGRIDIIINNEFAKLGIIIYGKKDDYCYSYEDDYRYYVTEYEKHGWQILLFSMEEINSYYDKIFEEIISVSKGAK